MPKRAAKSIDQMTYRETEKEFHFGVGAFGYGRMRPSEISDHMRSRLPSAAAMDKQMLAFRISGLLRNV